MKDVEIKFGLNANKKSGSAIIYLMATVAPNQRIKISTKMSVDVKEWDDKKKRCIIRKDHPEEKKKRYERINDRLGFIDYAYNLRDPLTYGDFLEEEELRKHISIIRQEPFVFNRTIKENFKLINKNISLKKIREYSKMAYLDDYIMSLPKGYDTLLGESGINLSGGQKQRLSIARTLSKGSEVILFDEATSALDNNSQDYIKKTIDNLVNDHTIVIVAHRLSTIIDADIIHVVDNGKVIATGNHKELLNSCKIYRNLYETESLNS